MASTKKSSVNAKLMKNIVMLANYVTPGSDGHVPAAADGNAAFANIGYRVGRILTFARRAQKGGSKGCASARAAS